MSDPGQERPILDYAPPPKPAIPRYRKWLSGLLIVAGSVWGIVGLVAYGFAREDALLYSFGFILWGVVIRYQHVRLW